MNVGGKLSLPIHPDRNGWKPPDDGLESVFSIGIRTIGWLMSLTLVTKSTSASFPMDGVHYFKVIIAIRVWKNWNIFIMSTAVNWKYIMSTMTPLPGIHWRNPLLKCQWFLQSRKSGSMVLKRVSHIASVKLCTQLTVPQAKPSYGFLLIMCFIKRQKKKLSSNIVFIRHTI